MINTAPPRGSVSPCHRVQIRRPPRLPPRLPKMASPGGSGGVRQGVPPISTKETEAHDTGCKEICECLGRRGGAWGARIVRKGGKARKGPREPMGSYGERGVFNTGTQRHGDKHGKPPCHRASVSPCLSPAAEDAENYGGRYAASPALECVHSRPTSGMAGICSPAIANNRFRIRSLSHCRCAAAVSCRRNWRCNAAGATFPTTVVSCGPL